MAERPLEVVIDARLASGRAGGVEAVVIGLASGLSALEAGPERYTFAAWEGDTEWLAPYVSGSGRVASAPPPPEPAAVATASTRRAQVGAALPAVRALWRRRPRRPPPVVPPAHDPFLDSLRPDVLHLPLQTGALADAPTIYHPHDLQHVHFPEFFSLQERRWRDVWYGALCRRAAMVAVASSWTKADVQTHFSLDPDRVVVVPLAPPMAATAPQSQSASDRVVAGLGLPSTYILYPAQTWPHKNHVGLLAALASLRDAGLRIPLVATGARNAHFPDIQRRAEELNLADQVTWTGFISPGALRAVYARARAVVVPSLFEAASAPLWEAFLAGVPAASSNVTSLPEQAGDAALLFDPTNMEAMASAIRTVWTDDVTRRRLVAAGTRHIRQFTWARTARTFRAHYRRLGGRSLTDEDRNLLQAAAPL